MDNIAVLSREHPDAILYLELKIDKWLWIIKVKKDNPKNNKHENKRSGK